MSKTINKNISKKVKLYQAASFIAYLAIVLGTTLILLIEPNNFDVRAIIIPVVALLLASSVGIGYTIAGKSNDKAIALVGTVALAILFTFIGFFVLAAVAWFIGLANAQ